MKITNIRINGIVNPVGFSFDRISCSWCVVGTESKKQSFARIEVSKNDDFSELTYVKEGKDLCQQGEVLLFALEPRTRYYYRIQVTGDQGDTAVSETAYWETGKMSEKWEADWIEKQKEDSFHCPLTTCYPVAKVTVVYPFAQMNWQIAIDYCTATTVKFWYLSFTEQFLSSGVMPS